MICHLHCNITLATLNFLFSKFDCLLLQEFLHLDNISVEIQVVKSFSQQTPIWASQSEEHEAQRNKVVVNDVTLAVKENAFLLPVEIRHAGLKKSGNVILVEVKCSAGLKEVVKAVCLKGHDL